MALSWTWPKDCEIFTLLNPGPWDGNVFSSCLRKVKRGGFIAIGRGRPRFANFCEHEDYLGVSVGVVTWAGFWSPFSGGSKLEGPAATQESAC